MSDRLTTSSVGVCCPRSRSFFAPLDNRRRWSVGEGGGEASDRSFPKIS